MRRLSFHVFLLACLLFLTSGCAAPASKKGEEPAAAGSSEPQGRAGGKWVRTELIFGLKRADGSTISAKEWAAFMAGVVTPRFPEGLTVLEGYGQYRNASGQMVMEPSNIVMILHPPDAAVDASVESVRAEYCRQFGQESVLKINSPADVFY
jgi:hypothetical protein